MSLWREGARGDLGKAGQYLTAWHRGEDTAEAMAGGLILAEAIDLLRVCAQALGVKVK